MAQIIDQIFGTLRGKVGGFVFKQRNGKTIISACPHNVKIDFSPKSVNRRNKFKMSSKFSSCLAQNPFLKKLWLNSEKSGTRSAFQIISKRIYPYVTHDDIAQNPPITPDYPGLHFDAENISIKKDSLSVSINPVPESEQKFYPSLELVSQIQMAVFIKISDPIYSEHESFRFLHLSSGFIPFNPDNHTNISISYIDQVQNYLSDYFSHRFFIIFFALDSGGNLVSFSNTFDIIHKNTIP